MDSASLAIGAGLPLLVGLYWLLSGLLKWFGIRKRWYLRPSRRGAQLQELIGLSPAPQILAGLGLIFSGGSLFTVSVSPLVPLIGVLIGALLIILGAVFIVYRPPWSCPAWIRQAPVQRQG